MKFLQSAFSFLPSILAAVISVESIVTGSGQGATKKQLVMNSILAASKAGETVPQPMVAGISALIDATVSTLNAANVFGFSTVKPVVPVPVPAA